MKNLLILASFILVLSSCGSSVTTEVEGFEDSTLVELTLIDTLEVAEVDSLKEETDSLAVDSLK
jgi:hypothetical protein